MKDTYKYIIIIVLIDLAVIALTASAYHYQAQSMALITTAAVLFGMGLFFVIKVMIMFFGGKHYGRFTKK